MKNKTYSMVILIVLLYCSKGLENKNEPVHNISSAELKLELTFGAGENIDNNYLLGRPDYMNVNEMGDVFICDGAVIKVYNSIGKPKAILGRKGQGPGEFIRPGKLNFSPTGLLTIKNGWYSYKIYNSNNELIDETSINSDFRYINYIENNKLIHPFPIEFTTLRNGMNISHIRAMKIEPGDPFSCYRILVKETPDSLYEIVRYKSKSQMIFRSKFFNFPYRGELKFAMTSENEIVYTDPGNDVIKNKNNPKYILHKFSLDTFEEQIITHPYNPIAVSDSLKEIYANIDDYPELKKYKNLDKIIKKIKEESKYACPIHKLLVDNEKIYLFTFQQNDKMEYLTDIFNAKSMEYIKSIYFPLSDYIVYNIRVPFDESVIKNGYLYMYSQNDEGEPVIKKYSINLD